MSGMIAGGAAGLLLGIALQRCRLTDRHAVCAGTRLRSHLMPRTLLSALGWGTLLTAFLAWLAVIDVDTLTVLPLNGGTVAGGIIFGAAIGLTGVTAGTALGMTGGGRFLEGLSAVAGGLAGAAVMPLMEPVRQLAAGLMPASANTLFRVTLDEPFLLGGGFLGQGCVGLIFLACGALLRPERKKQDAPDSAEEAQKDVSTDVQEVREETVVASLPGEEPVVVDTQQDEPVLAEHPEIDPPPEDQEDWTEKMARLEEAAGVGTPAQEEALPVGAKAVGEPEKRESGEEKQDENPR